MTLLVVSLCGGLGALARFLLDAAINARVRTALPLGTLTINVTGSLVLGFLAGWAAGHAGFPPMVQAAVGVGFCGGFTTFSTASVEAMRLWSADGAGAAARYVLLSVGGSTAAVALGLWAGFALP